MILIKVLVTILVVTFLSLIAERVGPRLAGILAGYPAGSAISLFFIGVETGPQFAGQSAMYNVAGLVALQVFLLVYYQVTARIHFRSRFASIAAGTTAAVASFLAAAALLKLINLPVWAGAGLTALAIPFFHFLFRTIDNSAIRQRVRLSPRVMLFRASISAGVVVIITGVAGLVGPQWAGLFSAFPVTVFPLILILHRTYGVEQAHTVIKNIPLGLWSLVLYSITVSFTYPRLGLAWGTLVSFGVATLYLLALAGARAWQNRSLARQVRTKLV